MPNGPGSATDRRTAAPTTNHSPRPQPNTGLPRPDAGPVAATTADNTTTIVDSTTDTPSLTDQDRWDVFNLRRPPAGRPPLLPGIVVEPQGESQVIAPPRKGQTIELVKNVPPTGTSGIGTLAPTGSAAIIPPEVAHLVEDPDKALGVSPLNFFYNPLKPVIGDYTKGSEVFVGKGFVPVKTIMAGLGLQLPAEAQQALKPVINSLPDITVLKTPAHQFNLGDKIGTRIVLYGGDRIGSDRLDEISVALRKKGIRLMTVMTHFNTEGQGGTPEQILSDGGGGSTHVGGRSGLVRGEWPSNYLRLESQLDLYNPHHFAINYQNGVKKEIPQEVLLEYAQNADMWDAVLGMIIPFADMDPDRRYLKYTENPVDAYDQKSLLAYANLAAGVDWEEIKKQVGAFNCAEGQYTVANLGPQAKTLLTKENFGHTKLGKLIEEFQKAPGLTPATPEEGWKHLLRKGLIDENMYGRLAQTGRLQIPLRWIPSGTPGWQEFDPIEPNGLIATPATVATLAWTLFRRYLPREGISTAVATELVEAYKTGDASVKAGIRLLLGGATPESDEGQKALSVVAFKASTGFLATALAKPELRDRLTKQAGLGEITNDKDKQALFTIYDKFVALLPKMTSQVELDKALFDADAELRSLEVERASRDPDTDKLVGKRKSLILYYAPSTTSAFAQFPFIAGTGDKNVLEYAFTAMNVRHAENPPR